VWLELITGQFIDQTLKIPPTSALAQKIRKPHFPIAESLVEQKLTHGIPAPG
jgi:hypothetical protein